MDFIFLRQIALENHFMDLVSKVASQMATTASSHSGTLAQAFFYCALYYC